MGWRWKNKKDLREVVEVERHLRKRNMENLDSRKKNLISVSAYCRPITIIIILVRPVLSLSLSSPSFPIRSDPIGGIEMTRIDSCQTHTCRHTINIYIDILEIHIYFMTDDIIKKHTKIKTSNTFSHLKK